MARTNLPGCRANDIADTFTTCSASWWCDTPRAAAVELRTPGRLRPRRACSRSKVRGVDFSLAYVLWSLDHVAVQWTCGVALDAVLGVFGVVRDAVLLELCPSARAQNARDVIMLDISG